MKINAKSIEGLKMLSKGLNLFIEGLVEDFTTNSEEVINNATEVVKALAQESELVVSPETVDEDGEVKPSINHITKVSAKEEESDDVEEETNHITEEDLSEMSYNNLKKYAKELGLSATGTRAELVKKILSANADLGDKTEPEEDIIEEETAEDIVEDSTTETSEEAEPEEVQEESDEEEDDEEEDPIVAQVNEAVEDMEDDELRELLESVDISPKGKRQSLIAKLIRAVQDGVIEFESEEEDKETADEITEEPEEVQEESDELVSSDITKDMTPQRRKTFDELCKETTEAFENEDILREDLIEFINDFKGTKDKMKKVSDEDLITQYLEISAMIVSDDGEIVEEGAYYINDEPYCCGHPLEYDRKKKVYRCKSCGEEYETE